MDELRDVPLVGGVKRIAIGRCTLLEGVKKFCSVHCFRGVRGRKPTFIGFKMFIKLLNCCVACVDKFQPMGQNHQTISEIGYTLRRVEKPVLQM